MAPKSTVLPDGTKTCTKCGRGMLVSGFYTTGKRVDGTPKYNSWCKTCVKAKMSSYHKDTYGPERLSFSASRRTRSPRAFLQYLLAKARRRGYTEVNVDHLLLLWKQQKGCCALTGWPMSMTLGAGVIPTNASIDRIDSHQAYVVGNVQLVCRVSNVAKSDLSTDQFLALCAAVVEKSNGA
jgi:hypothetical protein